MYRWNNCRRIHQCPAGSPKACIHLCMHLFASALCNNCPITSELLLHLLPPLRALDINTILRITNSLSYLPSSDSEFIYVASILQYVASIHACSSSRWASPTIPSLTDFCTSLELLRASVPACQYSRISNVDLAAQRCSASYISTTSTATLAT